MVTIRHTGLPAGGGLFAAGTAILVPHPESACANRAVESLRAGDSVCLWQGGTAAIQSITTRRIAIAAQPSPARAAPIRLRAGALADGIPSTDLLLPQEALLAFPTTDRREELQPPRLAPIGALVNGTTILRLPAAGEITWHGIVLASQAVLLAAASPVASLRGAGAPCLEMLPAGAGLLSLRASLAQRATRPEFAAPTPGPPPPPWIEPDPSRPLRLFIEGLEIEAEPAGTATEFTFRLPAGTGPVRLHAPGHDSPAPEDTRRLGVCVVSLALDGAPLALDGPAPGPGFHPMESNGTFSWRWTNGESWLVLPHSNDQRQLVVGITDWHRTLR